jgi:RNA polymerase sigma-B factor
MKQSALLRDWEWLQDKVVSPLTHTANRRAPKVWSIGSMGDAIAMTVAFAQPAESRGGGCAAYVTDYEEGAEPISFGVADLSSVPPANRAACFQRRERRWVPDPSIAEHVIVGEPDGPVDLLTVRNMDQSDGVTWSAEARLRRGGYLLVVDPPTQVPSDLRPLDDDGRLFQKTTAARRETGATNNIGQAESLARRQWQKELVNQHINLARSLAHRFRHRGEPVDDLEQVAFLALVKAARRFDPDQQAAFSTYATVSILGELKRHFRDKTWMLRVPRSTQELYLSIKDGREELGHSLGRTPTLEELAAHLGVEVGDVLEAMQAGATYWPSSLDAFGPDGELSIDIPVVDGSLETAVERQQLRSLLPQLDERERLLLKRIYFDGETQQQVASEIGASQMQVSRLLARTLGKLRDWCADKSADDPVPSRAAS